MSENAFGSGWVELERATPMFRIPENTSRRFIPLMLSDCDVPDIIRRYKYVDYRDESDEAFHDLLVACQAQPRKMPEPTTGESQRMPGHSQSLFARIAKRWSRARNALSQRTRNALMLILVAAACTAAAVAFRNRKQTVYQDVELHTPEGQTETIRLRLVAAGNFMMGSDDGESDERPQHSVTISRPFYMSIHEITQRQFVLMTGKPNNSGQKGESFPIDGVTFEDAAEFCNELSLS
jgi:hypothetical protein